MRHTRRDRRAYGRVGRREGQFCMSTGSTRSRAPVIAHTMRHTQKANERESHRHREGRQRHLSVRGSRHSVILHVLDLVPRRNLHTRSLHTITTTNKQTTNQPNEQTNTRTKKRTNTHFAICRSSSSPSLRGCLEIVTS